MSNYYADEIARPLPAGDSDAASGGAADQRKIIERLDKLEDENKTLLEIHELRSKLNDHYDLALAYLF